MRSVCACCVVLCSVREGRLRGEKGTATRTRNQRKDEGLVLVGLGGSLSVLSVGEAANVRVGQTGQLQCYMPYSPSKRCCEAVV